MIEINELLRIMVTQRASDLHLRVGSPPMMRIDGVLQPYGSERLSIEWIKNVVETILTERQKAVLQKELAVDSSYSIESFTRFRLNVFYQRGTLAIAFRTIFTKVPTIESLGLPTVLATLCDKPQGLILVSGPTGSGKSSTLAAMLQYINASRPVHIVTVEDPIEYLFRDEKAFITQREIGVDAPDYETALKNALRQDPDVVLIGEIRDRETAEIACRASLTGHLVLSTLHTNDAAGAVPRLIDMGVEPFLISSSLIGVVGQRLLRRLCTHCRYVDIPSPQEQAMLGNGVTQVYRSRGCPQCFQRGYSGRIAVHEVLLVNETIRQLTLQRAEAQRILQEALRAGMVTMQEDAVQKALAGVTSLQEVISKVGLPDTSVTDALSLAA